MSKQTEALKLALEALEAAEKHHLTTSLPQAIQNYGSRDAHVKAGFETWLTIVPHAITAIREALAEQPARQQEPVAWMDGYRNIYSLEEKAAGCPEATIALVPMANQEKTSGSPIKELNCICGAVWEGDELVHLPPPPASKPWVGLTETDLVDCDEEELKQARYWEAKLREKNA